MADYIKLEYIKTSGSQVINTGIVPISTTKWELTIEITGTGGLNGMMKSNSSGSFIIGGSKTEATYYCNNGASGYGFGSGSAGKHKFIIKNGYQGYDDIQINSHSYTTSGLTLYIGALHPGWTGTNNYISEKIYRSTLYQGDTLVQDLIPVKRKSDNKVCMYDLVSNQFYIGSGTFIAGPVKSDIKLLKINGLIQPKINGKKVYLFNGEQTHYDFITSYTTLDYIEGTGTQWLDTGIQPTTSTKIATKCSFSVDGGSVFIGATNLSDNNDFRIFRASGAYLYFDRGSDRLLNSLSLNTVYELEFGNWYMKIDGQTVQSGNAFDISLGSDTIKVMPTTNDYGRIYYLKIYDGDTLVRDFIPMKRDMDNEIGLYDKITKQFFTNQGTGSFIGG